MFKRLLILPWCLLVSLLASVYEVDFNVHPYAGQWQLPKGFVHDPTGGESGSGALRFEKRAGDPYVIASHRLVLEPGSRYRLTLMVRGENLENFAGKGIFAVEYKKNGVHIAGNYFSFPKGEVLADRAWTELALEVSPPSEFDTAALSLYLGIAVSGVVWYDNLRLAKVGAVPPDIFDLPPSNLVIRHPDAELAFKAVVYQATRPEELAMSMVAGAQEETVQAGADGYYRFRLRNLSPGRLPVKVALRHLPDGKILGEAAFQYFVTFAQPLAHGSWIGGDGLAVVDGKPFLPIGFYCRHLDPQVMARLADAGANVMMPYAIGREADLVSGLDLAWKHKLKVLFNVMYQHEHARSKVTVYGDARGIDAVLEAWVSEFRHHPALLGWYLSDENPRAELPRIRQMRERISELDPDHFTVTLTYRPIDFPAFISSGDVLATDPYPIETAASRSMAAVHKLIHGAVQLTPRVWMVPQVFSWGAYRQHENPELPYRFPTAGEIRSMVLAGAVLGAKGFLFYSYDSIFGRGEKKYPGTAETNWNQVVPTVKMLQELAPFLLSAEPAPEISVQGPGARARAWRHNEAIRVVVTGDGPGPCDVKVRIPGGAPLQSRFGLTEYLGDEIYRFRGQDICSDILESPAGPGQSMVPAHRAP